MKYGVSSNTLLLTAGIVWLVAGINILRIGISCWITDAHYWLLKVCEASLIFLLFFCMIFHKLYRKHAQRITAGNPNKRCPFSFFDVKGWLMMAFMIALGITIRTARLLPEMFYCGLLYRTFPRLNGHRRTFHPAILEKEIKPGYASAKYYFPSYNVEMTGTTQL